MLQPTGLAACHRISAYPPRERWVPDAVAYRQTAAPGLAFLHTHVVRDVDL